MIVEAAQTCARGQEHGYFERGEAEQLLLLLAKEKTDDKHFPSSCSVLVFAGLFQIKVIFK